MTKEELNALVSIIKNETGIGKNSATRVGLALQEIINLLNEISNYKVNKNNPETTGWANHQVQGNEVFSINPVTGDILFNWKMGKTRALTASNNENSDVVATTKFVQNLVATIVAGQQNIDLSGYLTQSNIANNFAGEQGKALSAEKGKDLKTNVDNLYSVKVDKGSYSDVYPQVYAATFNTVQEINTYATAILLCNVDVQFNGDNYFVLENRYHDDLHLNYQTLKGLTTGRVYERIGDTDRIVYQDWTELMVKKDNPVFTGHVTVPDALNNTDAVSKQQMDTKDRLLKEQLYLAVKFTKLQDGSVVASSVKEGSGGTIQEALLPRTLVDTITYTVEDNLEVEFLDTDERRDPYFNYTLIAGIDYVFPHVGDSIIRHIIVKEELMIKEIAESIHDFYLFKNKEEIEFPKELKRKVLCGIMTQTGEPGNADLSFSQYRNDFGTLIITKTGTAYYKIALEGINATFPTEIICKQNGVVLYSDQAEIQFRIIASRDSMTGALFVSVVDMTGEPVESTLDMNYIEFEWFDN